MDVSTTVWADDYGDSYGAAITGLELTDDGVIISTVDVSDYQGY